jgi:predicted phosphoribosyltransferase
LVLLKEIARIERLPLFRDRADAGRQLAQRLKGREFRNPLVMAIARGGLARPMKISTWQVTTS